jgi:hypothetical protein
MSFQAYLDNIEAKTGKAPEEFIQIATEKGFDPSSKPSEIVAWLKDDFQLGDGHARALAYVIINGAQITDRHVGAAGPHRDESDTLRLESKEGP